MSNEEPFLRSSWRDAVGPSPPSRASSFSNAVQGSHSARTITSGKSGDTVNIRSHSVPSVIAHVGGLTQYEAVGCIILMCFGVGLAVLPKGMSEAGYIITPLLMVLSAAVCSEQNVQISHDCDIAEELTGEDITCYEDLVNVCGNDKMVVALRFSKAFGLLISVSSFVQFASANCFVLAMATGHFGDWQLKVQEGVNYFRFLLITPILVCLAMLKDLKHFARIMNVGVLAATVNGGTIVLGGVLRWFSIPDCQTQLDPGYATGACIFRTADPSTNGPPVLKIGMAASVSLFGMMVVGSYPNTRHQMEDPKKIHNVAFSAFWLTMIIYVVVMVGGYMGTGQAVKQNALDDFANMPIVYYTGLLAQIVDTLVASPIYILCVINAFESTGTDRLHTPLALPNAILRASTVAVVVIVSFSVPYPEIIVIAAAFFGIFTHLVLPIFVTGMLKRKWIAAGRDPARMQISCIRQGARVLIVIFGVVVGFFSIYGGVQTLMAEMK